VNLTRYRDSEAQALFQRPAERERERERHAATGAEYLWRLDGTFSTVLMARFRAVNPDEHLA